MNTELLIVITAGALILVLPAALSDHGEFAEDLLKLYRAVQPVLAPGLLETNLETNRGGGLSGYSEGERHRGGC